MENIKNLNLKDMRLVEGKLVAEICEQNIAEIINEVEKGFAQLSNGDAVSPPFINFPTEGLHGKEGHVHFKAGYVRGDDYFVFKYSAGFWGNQEVGIPTDTGFFMIFDAKTGQPVSLIEGGDFTLTDHRTAAAGAVASKWLSRENSKTVGIIGNGVQAKLQLIYLSKVRNIESVKVWGRNTSHVAEYIDWMGKKFPDINLVGCKEIKDVVSGVDVLVTAVPSSQPIIFSEWISKGTHITGVGACGPTMQELDAKVFGLPNVKIYADSIEACSTNGDIHHALEEKVITRSEIKGNLGDVIIGSVKGRASDDDITIVDLVGLGVQDAKIGNWFYKKISC
ncbi:MAG: Ornithine cyclodeaminase [Candidatus Woesebacteria bacterium GW2011_GWA1_33_30]|uniref:Ornithine cyclodeaminase n=1 Tax=Candidatus Woesebacteria bacterium GW2011_GWA2_33_28 TaxID=1618561 RepID=A0A0F9ZVP3_9BACT|nr:MAG: Ornithine cyclodeaminase [Candidatus Woesebacteria bacterium GW2011_GWA2_33_28]KKP49056.1 MAG: Ornithine cyclodeaminase [Candidatus Woesebacteria bacterium GW2011_GWA1_33_30]KKP49836.1 MAG: Ornithine cyclodeaminase [Microgenomates group bacterium GW2011_GWC1_33_32]KKP52648.1 MAG: Ornithine cyclodeaminase [Candidatus Woesebacteria bacterium GW2011_GWB1_33_38]KKP58825.1 MAG: Ornithine cyclodeaminase [Microgenomates group bacterium GW2011_GWD1_33_9]